LILGDGVLVVGVEVPVGSSFADGKDGCSFAAVFPSKDDGGVLSVGSLDLDIVFFLLLDCCRALHDL
jgi:hypothetical protein